MCFFSNTDFNSMILFWIISLYYNKSEDIYNTQMYGTSCKMEQRGNELSSDQTCPATDTNK